jgi:hypothetical protein
MRWILPAVAGRDLVAVLPVAVPDEEGALLNVTWSALLPGLACATCVLGLLAAIIWGRRLPDVVRVLLAVPILPLAAFAFLLISIGVGLSGR